MRKQWFVLVLCVVLNTATASAQCWSEDLKLKPEWDTYFNSSIERLMKNESTPLKELLWLIENWPEVSDRADTVYECLNP